MYSVLYEYGGNKKYFSNIDSLMEEFHRGFGLNRSIEFEPYINYLSRLTLFEVRKSFGITYANIDSDVANEKIGDLIVIYDKYEADNILICSKNKWEHNLADVLNYVADYFNSGFYVEEIKRTVIAVIDSDNEPLGDMFSIPGKTLWYDVDVFISDTRLHNIDNSVIDEEIKTYIKAVKYWENMYFDVISNYDHQNTETKY